MTSVAQTDDRPTTDDRSFGRIVSQSSTTSKITALIALTAVVAGLALRIGIAWRDLTTLTLKILPDDAFYYFLTAERISRGEGITFDGFTSSNGYHPLWLFSLVPVYLLPGRELPLHAALTMSSVFDVTAACLIALAALRLTGSAVSGLFTLCFYLFIPQNVFSAVNGVESAMTTVLLASLLLVVVSAWREERANWLRWSIGTGALGGLTVLGRLDAVLVVAAIFCVVCLLQKTERWRKLAIMCAVAGVLVFPWFLWSWLEIGTPVPVSGESATWLQHEHFAAAHPDASSWDYVEQGLSSTKFIFLTQLPALYFPDRAFAALLLTCGALVTAHYVLFSRGSLRRDTARQLLIAGPPLAAFFAMLLVNSGYRWFVREWYVAWGMPCVALFAGVFFNYTVKAIETVPLPAARRSLTRGPLQLALFGILVLLFVLAFIPEARETWRIGPYFFQRNNLDAALYLRENTQPDERVAAFNAGVVGYFSDRDVVNIDGVVNPDAFEAMRNKHLAQYLRNVNVDYVADRQGAWTFLPLYVRPDDWRRSPWGEDPNRAMTNVTEIGRGNIATQYRIWRMK